MATDTCNALKVSIASLDNGTRQPACPRRCIPFPKGCNGECNYCIICSIGGAAVGLRTFTAVKVEAWSKSQVSCVGGPGEAELRVASRSVAICYSQYRFESAADKTLTRIAAGIDNHGRWRRPWLPPWVGCACDL